MNFDFGILELLFVISVAFLFVRKMSRINDEITNIINNEPETNIEIVVGRSEVHDNEIFLWDKNSNTFLSQGPNIETAIAKFLKNNSKKKIVFEVKE